MGDRHLSKILWAACVGALLLAPAAAAQEKKPTVQFNAFTAKNLVIGKRFKVDEAFGQKYKIAVEAPFVLTVPTDKSYRSLAQPTPKPGDAYVKFNFATHDLKLIENLQFVRLTLPMDPLERRLNGAAQLMKEKAFRSMVQGHQEPKILTLRQIKIGPYEAAELIGRYIAKDLGLMYVRIVSIPNPDGPASVMSLANVVASYVEIKGPDDLTQKTRSGGAMTTFRYLKK